MMLHSSQTNYIHNVFVLGINFLPNYISVTYFSGINFPKITLHVFVCDSEHYMENCFGIIFLENLISVTWIVFSILISQQFLADNVMSVCIGPHGVHFAQQPFWLKSPLTSAANPSCWQSSIDIRRVRSTTDTQISATGRPSCPGTSSTS